MIEGFIQDLIAEFLGVRSVGMTINLDNFGGDYNLSGAPNLYKSVVGGILPFKMSSLTDRPADSSHSN